MLGDLSTKYVLGVCLSTNTIRGINFRVLVSTIIDNLDVIDDFECPLEYQRLLANFNAEFSTRDIPTLLLNQFISSEQEHTEEKEKNGKQLNLSEHILFIKIYHFLYLSSLQNEELKLSSEKILLHLWRSINNGFFTLSALLKTNQLSLEAKEICYKRIVQYKSLADLYYPAYKKQLEDTLNNKQRENAEPDLQKIRSGLFQAHHNLVLIQINSAVFFFEKANYADAFKALFRSRAHMAHLESHLLAILIASHEHLSYPEKAEQQDEDILSYKITNEILKNITENNFKNQDNHPVVALGLTLDKVLQLLLNISKETEEFCNLPQNKLDPSTSKPNQIEDFKEDLQTLSSTLSQKRKETTALEKRLETVESDLHKTAKLFLQLQDYDAHPQCADLTRECMKVCIAWKLLLITDDTPIPCAPMTELLDNMLSQLRLSLTRPEQIEEIVNFNQRAKAIEPFEFEKSYSLINEYHEKLLSPVYFKLVLTSLVESVIANFKEPNTDQKTIELLESKYYFEKNNLLFFIIEFLLKKEYSLPDMNENDYLQELLSKLNIKSNEISYFLLMKMWPGIDYIMTCHSKFYAHSTSQRSSAATTGRITELLNKYKNISDYLYPQSASLAMATLNNDTQHYSIELINTQKKSLWNMFYFFASIEIEYCVFLFESKRVEDAKESFELCRKKYHNFKANQQKLIATTTLQPHIIDDLSLSLNLKYLSVQNLYKQISDKSIEKKSEPNSKRKTKKIKNIDIVSEQKKLEALDSSNKLLEQEKAEKLARQQEKRKTQAKKQKQKTVQAQKKLQAANELKAIEQQKLEEAMQKEAQKQEQIKIQKEKAAKKKESIILKEKELSKQKKSSKKQKKDALKARLTEEALRKEELAREEVRLAEEARQQEALSREQLLFEEETRIAMEAKHRLAESKHFNGMMKIAHQFVLPENIRQILKVLNDAGYYAYLTGGYPRDCFLKIMPNDFDIITDCPNDKILSVLAEFECLKNLKRTGLYHINNQKIDISSTNLESLEEEMAKKDLTINSLFWDQYNNIYGTPDILNDLEANNLKIIGNIDDRLKNDPSIILRLVYYRGKLKKEIPDAYIKYMVDNAPLILTMKFGIYLSSIKRIFSNVASLDSLSFIVHHKILPHLLVSQPSKEIIQLLAMDNYQESRVYAFWQEELSNQSYFNASHVIATLLAPIAIANPQFAKDRISVVYQNLRSFRNNFQDLEEEKNIQSFFDKLIMQNNNCIEKCRSFQNRPIFSRPLFPAPAYQYMPQFNGIKGNNLSPFVVAPEDPVGSSPEIGQKIILSNKKMGKMLNS